MFERLPLVWTARGVMSREEHSFARLDDLDLDNRCLIETTRTLDGVPWLWSRHLARAQSSLQQLEVDDETYLGALPMPHEIVTFVKQLDAGDIVVRLNLLLDEPLSAVDDVWVDARRLPPHRDFVRLQTMTRETNPNLPESSFKGFGRSILANHRDHAQQLGADDALLLERTGHVTETTWANIFLKFDDTWMTPPADGSILPGIARAFLLERQLRSTFSEGSISAAALPRCKGAFVCNSVRGIVPVAQIDSIPITIDPVALDLRDHIFKS